MAENNAKVCSSCGCMVTEGPTRAHCRTFLVAVAMAAVLLVARLLRAQSPFMRAKLTANTILSAAASQELPQTSWGKLVSDARHVDANQITNLTALVAVGTNAVQRVVRVNPSPSATDVQIEALNEQKLRAQRAYARGLLGKVVAVAFRVDAVESTDDGRFIITGHLHWRAETTYTKRERVEIAAVDASYHHDVQAIPEESHGPKEAQGLQRVAQESRDSAVERIAARAKAPQAGILICTDNRNVMQWRVGDYHTVECVVVGAADGINPPAGYDYSGAYIKTRIELCWVRSTIPQASTPRARRSGTRFVFHLVAGGVLHVSSYKKAGTHYQMVLSDGAIIAEDISAVSSIEKRAIRRGPQPGGQAGIVLLHGGAAVAANSRGPQPDSRGAHPRGERAGAGDSIVTPPPNPIMPLKYQFVWPARLVNPKFELTIRRDGSVAKVKVLISSGYTGIDQAIINALMQARFLPNIVEGKLVQSKFVIRYQLAGTVPQALPPAASAWSKAVRFVFHLTNGGRLEVSSYTRKGAQYQITLSDGIILAEDVSAVASIDKKEVGVSEKGR